MTAATIVLHHFIQNVQLVGVKHDRMQSVAHFQRAGQREGLSLVYLRISQPPEPMSASCSTSNCRSRSSASSDPRRR
jgi:hypothetical protein